MNTASNDAVPVDVYDADDDGDSSEGTPDLDLYFRNTTTTVDMGAYEFRVIHVWAGAASGGDGTSWTDAHTNLQAALTEARALPRVEMRLEIWVAEGTYKPTACVDGEGEPADCDDDDRSVSFDMMRGLLIWGGYDDADTDFNEKNPLSNVCTLSGDIDTSGTDDSYHVVTAFAPITNRDTSLLWGFTVTGGNANGTGDNEDLGGGMLIDEAEINVFECIFKMNKASKGGGMALAGATGLSTHIESVVFDRNEARDSMGLGYGGAMYNNAIATINNYCTFVGNTATGDGGAVYNIGSGGPARPTYNGGIFRNNTADGNGGGMYNTSGVAPRLENCTFENNSAVNGGGIYNNAITTERFAAMAFYGNDAREDGGGVYNNAVSSTMIMVSCLFSGNTADNGGGVYNANSDPDMINMTFSVNKADDGSSGGQGGGIYNDSSSAPDVDNCILWGNISSDANQTEKQMFSAGISVNATVDYTCIKGGWSGPGGTGNITDPPLFIDALGCDNIPGTDDDDLHLSTTSGSESPCIDVGSSDQLPADADGGQFDLDGLDRRVDFECDDVEVVDMGAYEVQNVCP